MFKRKQTDTLRRPNLGNTERQPSRTTYYSRRIDTEVNLGRQQDRVTPKPKSNNLLNFWLQRFGLLVLIIVILASIISALSLSNSPRIIILKSSGYELLADDDYLSAGC